MLALLAAVAHAGTTLYASVAGGLGFTLHNIGDFAVGAEHVFGAHHGVVAEGTYVHVHGDPTHSTTGGVQLGYRYHAAEVNAPFVGVMLGYEPGFSKYFIEEHGGPFWRYDLLHLSAVPHVGYRWGLGERVAITARFGGGYGWWRVTTDDADAPDSAGALIRDRLQYTPVKLDSELSIGVRF